MDTKFRKARQRPWHCYTLNFPSPFLKRYVVRDSAEGRRVSRERVLSGGPKKKKHQKSKAAWQFKKTIMTSWSRGTGFSMRPTMLCERLAERQKRLCVPGTAQCEAVPMPWGPPRCLEWRRALADSLSRFGSGMLNLAISRLGVVLGGCSV